MAKKDGPEGDGQAAVQCKRMGDPTAWGGPPKRSRSEPEARRRYYRSTRAKAVCAYAPAQRDRS